MPEDQFKNLSVPEKADVAAMRMLSGHHGKPWLRILSSFSKLGDQAPLRAVSGAVVCAGILSGNRRLARTGVRMLAADAVAGFAKNWVKRKIQRTRPALLIRDGEYEMGFGRSPDHERRSFPSGHSACAVAVGRAFTREYPEYSGLPELAAALIALSQIPRGKHYPTDVGAGSALGMLSEWFLANALLSTGRMLTASRTKSGD